jgi:hypothetical protein
MDPCIIFERALDLLDVLSRHASISLGVRRHNEVMVINVSVRREPLPFRSGEVAHQIYERGVYDIRRTFGESIMWKPDVRMLDWPRDKPLLIAHVRHLKPAILSVKLSMKSFGFVRSFEVDHTLFLRQYAANESQLKTLGSVQRFLPVCLKHVGRRNIETPAGRWARVVEDVRMMPPTGTFPGGNLYHERRVDFEARQH